MKGLSAPRAAVAAAGLVVGLFGAFSLLRLGLSNLAWSVGWLIGGVLFNDFVLAPVVIGACVVGARVLPRWARAPVVAGVIVLGALTLLAVPVLGRFGALPDNPSLLDRSYGLGWLAVAALVSAGVALACVLGRRQAVAKAPSGG